MSRKNKRNTQNKEPIPNPQEKKTDLAQVPIMKKLLGENIINSNQAELLVKENELRAEIETIINKYKAKTSDLELQQVDYNKKLTEIEGRKDELIKLKSDLNDKQLIIKKQEDIYDKNNKELQKDKIQFEKDKSSYSQKLIQFRQEQEILATEKANAELGFAKENATALELRKSDLEQLTQEHKECLNRQNELLAKKEKDIDQRELATLEEENSLSQNNSDVLKKLKDDWYAEKSQQESELQLKVQEFENQQISLEQQKNDSSIKEQQIEQTLRIQYESQVLSLKQVKKHLEKSHQSDLDKITELNNKLLHYADLERDLENNNIESVKTELEDLRENNRILKQKLSERRVDGLEEENELLESRADDLEEQVHDLRAENEEIKSELYTLRISTLEKHNLQKEKRALDNITQAQELRVDQLSKQLDQLEGSQKENLAFKALNNMDEEYRDSARNLQPTPDLKQFTNIIQSNIAKQGFHYDIHDIRLFIAGMAMSKLHLLQGISGTGKTSLPRTFAKAMNNVNEKGEGQYCEIVRVQAGWRDKEDLIGYYNEFEKKFNTKEALQAIYRAQQPKFKDTVQIILLDEMNLSQPEQYFAEFLSILETPDRATINLLDYGNENNPKYFVDQKSIKIPNNVWFIGTANHDETTKEFADKTYDRAHVMEVKRSKDKCMADDTTDKQYSFSSLTEKFKQSEKVHGHIVENIFNKLKNSELESELHDVGVSWGNRLEKQAKSFIPVYHACGGEVSEALDHLFASKVFRHGKLTGRYDINAEQIQNIKIALEAIWEKLGFATPPIISDAILDKDIKRLSDL